MRKRGQQYNIRRCISFMLAALLLVFAVFAVSSYADTAQAEETAAEETVSEEAAAESSDAAGQTSTDTSGSDTEESSDASDAAANAAADDTENTDDAASAASADSSDTAGSTNNSAGSTDSTDSADSTDSTAGSSGTDSADSSGSLTDAANADADIVQEISGTFEGFTEGEGTYMLTADSVWEETFEAEAGTYVLDLNGFTLTVSAADEEEEGTEAAGATTESGETADEETAGEEAAGEETAAEETADDDESAVHLLLAEDDTVFTVIDSSESSTGIIAFSEPVVWLDSASTVNLESGTAEAVSSSADASETNSAAAGEEASTAVVLLLSEDGTVNVGDDFTLTGCAAAMTEDELAAAGEAAEDTSDGDEDESADADSEEAESSDADDTAGSSADADSGEEDDFAKADSSETDDSASADSSEDTLAAAAAETAAEETEMAEAAVVSEAAAAASGTSDDPYTVSGTLSSFSSGQGTYQLTGDTTMSSQIQISSGTYVLDLNGYTLTATQYFMIYGSSTLTIMDSSDDETGIIKTSAQLIFFYGAGTFNLTSGTIDGSNASSYNAQNGGCVWMYGQDSVFNMSGGTIQNFKASQYGGAVYLSGGTNGPNTFTMSGGTIKDCSAASGGAVYIGSTSSTSKTATFTMTGGSITDCTASSGGGCIYCDSGSTLQLLGKSKITISPTTDTTCTGSGIYFYRSQNALFEISGILDIDGIVYLLNNNWSSGVTNYIEVVGPLVVTGDGVIDVDTKYPSAKSDGTYYYGHTVVHNATYDEDTEEWGVSEKTFYTYRSYFVNTTKNLGLSAGYSVSFYETYGSEYGISLTTASGVQYPSNWGGQSDTGDGNEYYYYDVMGNLMYVEAQSAYALRNEQSSEYLIYTARYISDSDTDTSAADEYYSVKLIKVDADSTETVTYLDGAVFSLSYTGEDESEATTYSSGETGDSDDGAGDGTTYIYADSDHSSKLMLTDGTATLTETTAPDGYSQRSGTLATIVIAQEYNSSSGAYEYTVKVNGVTLTAAAQAINSSDTTYGSSDTAYLSDNEIVITLGNTTESSEDGTITLEALPTAGSTGILLWSLAGALLAGTCAGALPGLRRKFIS